MQKINQMPLKVQLAYKATRIAIIQVIFILIKKITYLRALTGTACQLFRDIGVYLVSMFL